MPSKSAALCVWTLWYLAGIEASGATSAACTAPRPPTEARRAFCFVSAATISPQAAKFLRDAPGVKPYTSLRGRPAAEQGKAQAAYNALAAPRSAEAAKQFLQGVTNDTVGGVPVTVGTPKGFSSSRDGGKLLLYLHGGAYVKGSCQHLWMVTGQTARLSGLRVMCVDYRLAPQHPFPAGLDDALAVYSALVQHQGGRHHTAPGSIGLVGDSAGGGLALALLQRIKAAGLPLPGAVGLMAPWSDLRKHGDSFTVLTGVDPTLQYELNLAGSASDYVGGNDSQLTNPLVSPLLADYARPFPPTLIQVGLRDSLLSSAVLLYRKMVAGGLRELVTLSPWEGLWHVFQAYDVPEAQEASAELAAFFRQHLKG